ncbi:acidic mammalian chitinase [Lepeophtheirus salmonis]|uniref:acidic mammalian chitinase n=1 Tax=Lepeophtheirus salmonis TaxID=72036 RepID=UPI001AE8C862|nr:acidic mammalian chitinase-like [Lepeophtheirus salmonis]
MKAFVLIGGLILFLISSFQLIESKDKAVLCYFSSWATYRRGKGKFDIENIDPSMCTHVAYGFAGIDENTYKIKVLDPYNDLTENWGKGGYKRFTDMKKKNSNLITLLSVGGWNEGANKYSKMAALKIRRTTFIQSAITLLKKYGFDGLDFDWEYPGGRLGSQGSPEDKVNYVKLIKELRTALDKAGGLKLTAAVSAGKNTIDKGYDVQAMGMYMDYINVMTYDYHGWWGGHHFTGHNSPLYALPEEQDPSHPAHNLNANFSMNYYAMKGAPKDKLLMGMGAYGRGFILNDARKNGFYARAMNGIEGGPYTDSVGFWGFNEYCEKMKSSKSQWTLVRSPYAVAPYSYNGNKWFGFDDKESIRVKSQYILDQGFGGGFSWSIDTDDFLGLCGQGNFPLVSTMKEVLMGYNGQLMSSSTQKPTLTTTKPLLESSDQCLGIGLIPYSKDCTKYIHCIPNNENGYTEVVMDCPPGLYFNFENLNCDWPSNVSCP